MSFYSFYDIQNLREKIKNMKNYINNELSVLNKQRNDYISKNYKNSKNYCSSTGKIYFADNSSNESGVVCSIYSPFFEKGTSCISGDSIIRYYPSCTGIVGCQLAFYNDMFSLYFSDFFFIRSKFILLFSIINVNKFIN